MKDTPKLIAIRLNDNDLKNIEKVIDYYNDCDKVKKTNIIAIIKESLDCYANLCEINHQIYLDRLTY